MGSTAQLSAYMPLVVGLSAVAATLIANTLLEIFKRYLSDRSTARAIAACLIAELEIRLGAAQGGVAAMADDGDGGVFSFVVPERHPF